MGETVKMMMLTGLWNMKGPITNDFPDKGVTVNSHSHCQLLKQNSSYLLNDPHSLIINIQRIIPQPSDKSLHR